MTKMKTVIIIILIKNLLQMEGFAKPSIELFPGKNHPWNQKEIYL